MWWLWLSWAMRWQVDLIVVVVLVVAATALVMARLPALASTRALLATALVSTAVCIVLTVVLAIGADGIVRAQIESQLRTLAATFVGEFASLVREDGAAPDREQLAAVRQRRAKLHRDHPDLGPIYLFRRDPVSPDRQWILFDDLGGLTDRRVGGPEGTGSDEHVGRSSPDASDLDTAPAWFSDRSRALASAWDGDATVNEFPTPREDGYWITGYAPMFSLRDPETVEAVLGVDYPGEQWVRRRVGGRSVGLAIGLALTASQMAVLVLLGLTRRRLEDSRDKLTQSEAVRLLTRGEIVPQLPLTFGPYRLTRLLGRGGMGVVYEAEEIETGRLLAIKVLDTSLTTDDVSRTRFQREIEHLRLCEHENLVRSFEAVPVEGVQVLLMERVPGTNISTLVPTRGKDSPPSEPLAIADACEIARQAALGLDYLHEKGILHRDIKPANLMVTPDGVVKILDLGLSRLLPEAGDESTLTRTRQILGSYDYLPPEMASSDHAAVSGPADLYGLGGTLFKMLTGRGPFEDEKHQSFASKLLAHIGQTAPDVRTLRASVPPGLSVIVAKLLAKQPEQRYRRGAEVATALAPYCLGADLASLGHVEEDAWLRSEDAAATRPAAPTPTVAMSSEA